MAKGHRRTSGGDSINDYEKLIAQIRENDEVIQQLRVRKHKIFQKLQACRDSGDVNDIGLLTLDHRKLDKQISELAHAKHDARLVLNRLDAERIAAEPPVEASEGDAVANAAVLTIGGR